MFGKRQLFGGFVDCLKGQQIKPLQELLGRIAITPIIQYPLNSATHGNPAGFDSKQWFKQKY